MKTSLSVIEPAHFKLDGGAMFGIIPRPLWEKKIKPDEYGRIPLALRLLLIETEDRKILLDTGIGDYHGENFMSQFDIPKEKFPLTKALEERQLKPHDITDIILSHLHFDHVGGLFTIAQGEPLPCFPRAVIHLHKKHYQYALAPTPRDSGSFQSQFFIPIIQHYEQEGKIHWLEGEEGSICEDLKFKTSMGHTPYMIHPYNDDFIYLADLIPTEAHLPPAWVMGYDISPGITSVEKNLFLDFALEKNLLCFFEHDHQSYGGHIKKNSKGHFICEPLYKSKRKKIYSIHY